MTEVKTKVSNASVKIFLEKVKNSQRREDTRTVLRMMQRITHKQPKLWGPSIIGFDKYRYQYASGHSGDICIIGLSPRSQALTLYVMSDFAGYADLLKKLGKHKRSKACLYINKLEDVDLAILEKIIHGSYSYAKHMYG